MDLVYILAAVAFFILLFLGIRKARNSAESSKPGRIDHPSGYKKPGIENVVKPPGKEYE
jgi:hypothetical protein